MPLGLTLLVAMGIAWAIAVFLLSNAIDRRLDAQLENATSILAEGTFPFSADLIGNLDRLIEARILLLDEKANVGLSSGDSSLNQALGEATDRIVSTKFDEISYLTLSTGNTQWRAAVQRLQQHRDERFSYVMAAASLSSTRIVARDSALLLGAAMFLAAAVLALVGSVITRGITHPIARLADMADRIAEGDRGISTDIDENNEIGVLARALSDMSEKLRDYEDELARQSRRSGLGDLAARMAHEVRNPLTAMKMQLQLLKERVNDADVARIDTVLNELRRLELIVESTLVIGSPLDLQLTSLDPSNLIDDVVELLQPALRHRNIELKTKPAPLPISALDGNRIKQVLLNLINNAADALKQGGDIRISGALRIEENSFDIIVEDSGPGVDVQQLAEQPKKPFSLGLGLAISREIIDSHGGELLVGESSDLGGACFTIRLPVVIIAA